MKDVTTFDTISFIASIASLILAIGAIWLSVVFYRMSSEASRATTEAAKGIGAIVERLEKLFDKLYSDTFSMMRDTVSDMRKHIWPAETTEQDKALEDVEKKADEKIDALRSSMKLQLSDMLKRQKIAEDKMSSIRNEMGALLEKAIGGSRQAESEAREETLRDHITQMIRAVARWKAEVTIGDIMEQLISRFPPTQIINEIERMIHDGLIIASTDSLRTSTAIRPAQMRGE